MILSFYEYFFYLGSFRPPAGGLTN